MTEPLRLTGEAAELASRIRTIDRDLDRIEAQRERSVVLGMKVTGIAALAVHRGQDASDAEHADLLSQRADLVVRLKRLMGDA